MSTNPSILRITLTLKRTASVAVLALGLAAAGSASAHDKHHDLLAAASQATAGAGAVDATTPILFSNLGKHHYAIETSNPLAQRYFDQGLRLAYGFNHAEAARAFRYARELDPDCTLCYWGEALVLGPNINAAMAPDATAPALAAVAKGRAIPSAGAKDQALLAALATRYSSDPKAERASLDARYAEAMVEVAARFPDDMEIKVLAAEALMNTQAWDYWEGSAGSRKPKGRTSQILGFLEEVLKANPDHPGAIHFYLHMLEASDTPELGEPYADRLAALMPGAGHIVHMPSHIYYRVGRYADSLKLNIAAAEADATYLAKAVDASFYAGTYYPHNVHYVLASAQMAGDSKTVIAFAEKVARVVPDESAATVAWVQPIKAAPYFAYAQFSKPDEILAVQSPGDTFPYVKGTWHYARGVAFAAKGDLKSAKAEADAIDAIATKADLSFLISNYVPADQLLQIARQVVLARIAQAGGERDAAIDHFSRAVKIQDGIPYMEPPYWYYPVRQSLGAALLADGRTEEAAAIFKDSLKESPNNGWAIYGLIEAHKKLGDAANAEENRKLLAKAWVGPSDLLDLSRL